MLYEFHRTENAKNPNTVNATYVITGFQKQPETLPPHGNQSQDNTGDDDIPQSSPYISSSMPTQDPVVESGAMATIVLVRGEELDGMFYLHDRGGWLLMNDRGEGYFSSDIIDICV